MAATPVRTDRSPGTRRDLGRRGFPVIGKDTGMNHFRVIIASLLGATFLVSPVAAQQAPQQAPKHTPAQAQQAPAKTPEAKTPDSKQPPAAAAATSSKPETVEQRITTLKTSLKITPEQEPKWNAVAQAMRENAASMDKLVQAKKGKSAASMTAVDDLQTYQEFAQAHVDGLKNLIPAFKALYDSMPDEQKKNADMVFEKYGPAGNGRHQRQERQG